MRTRAVTFYFWVKMLLFQTLELRHVTLTLGVFSSVDSKYVIYFSMKCTEVGQNRENADFFGVFFFPILSSSLTNFFSELSWS